LALALVETTPESKSKATGNMFFKAEAGLIMMCGSYRPLPEIGTYGVILGKPRETIVRYACKNDEMRKDRQHNITVTRHRLTVKKATERLLVL
jgi:hypothetical protein